MRNRTIIYYIETLNFCYFYLSIYRNESEFIKDIVKEISNKLIPTKFDNKSEVLVGIESRYKKLMRLLDFESYVDVCMIKICGMGGLGKTTIVRVIYDLISPEFLANSFHANVREISKKGSLIYLYKQLLFELLKIIDISIWNVYEGINMISKRLSNVDIIILNNIEVSKIK